jgi:hypothetical protein
MTTGMLTLLLTLGVGGTPPDVYTMRNTNLEIPIRINDAKRPDIKELELHVSIDQGRTWTLSGRAKPEQQAFGFHAQGDGLYWFSVCAIDKVGRRDPEDIARWPGSAAIARPTRLACAWNTGRAERSPRPSGRRSRSRRRSLAPTASARCTAAPLRCGCKSRTAPVRQPPL